MVTQDTLPLRRIVGPYTCMRLLGIGTNNSVYEAIHYSTRSPVALRVMTIIRSDREAAAAECLEELAQIEAVRAPYVVELVDYGVDEDTLYIASRLMDGGSLAHRMYHQSRPHTAANLPSLGEVASIVRDLAAALDAIHSAGLVHGQVEPNAILFDRISTHAYLSEVGITRLFKIIYSLGMTNSFNMSRYSAPELWEGKRPQPASDLYSLACMVYELVTGQPPFRAETIYGLMKQHQEDVAMPPHYMRAGLPADLALLFWQAMAKPIEKRHRSVTAFYEEFREAIVGYEGEPTGFFEVQVS